MTVWRVRPLFFAAAICESPASSRNRRKAVARNYRIAAIYYSYTVLQRKLHNLLTDCMACIKLNN